MPVNKGRELIGEEKKIMLGIEGSLLSVEGNSTPISSSGVIRLYNSKDIIRTKQIPSIFGNGNFIQKSTLVKGKRLLRHLGLASLSMKE